MAEIKPFTINPPAEAVEAVLSQVRAYPWPVSPEVEDGWNYGCDGAFLKGLCAYWTDGYDWRAAVADLNKFPQFTAPVEDFTLHFVHVVGEAGGKRPLLISHGWPGSHFEFWGSIEKLAFPSRFGGKPEDAFDVINLKISKVGGLTKARQMRDLCVSHGIPMTIEDTWGGDIVTATIAHLARSTPERFCFTATDFNSYVTVSIADGAPKREKGFMTASDEPGLGVTPKWEVLGDPVQVIK